MAKALLLVESEECGWGPELLFEDSKLLQLLAQAGLNQGNIDLQSVRLLSTGTASLGIAFETKEIPVTSFGRLATALAESKDIISAKMFVPFAEIHGSAKKE
jgi:hypothetical protein